LGFWPRSFVQICAKSCQTCWGADYTWLTQLNKVFIFNKQLGCYSISARETGDSSSPRYPPRTLESDSAILGAARKKCGMEKYLWKHSISPLTYPSFCLISRTVMVLVWQLQQ
jgi:hypothetical protein